MTDLDRKIHNLLKLNGGAPKFPSKSQRKVALYDFNGTLVSDMKGSGMDNYEQKLRQAFGPLREIGDAELAKAIRNSGITTERGKIKTIKLGAALTEAVISLIKSPKRGTKAREIYYDFLELAVERGEIKLKAFPDALATGNLIERDRKEGLSIISLSRGTDSILQKSIKASGTDRIIDKMYSTIPFGGEKTAECYYRFYLSLLADGIQITKSYEDEWANVEGMMVADVALAIKLHLKALPFKIHWIDRKKERQKPEIKNRIGNLAASYGKASSKYGWRDDFSGILFFEDGLHG